MERFSKERLQNIKNIFQEKTGVNVTIHKDDIRDGARRMTVALATLACVLVVSALSFAGFGGVVEEEVDSKMSVSKVLADEREEIKVQNVAESHLMETEWLWPTVSEKISSPFGQQRNGAVSDHINIAGNEGDEVYAVGDGSITETGFDSVYGNYIVMDLGEGVTVKYGHLKEILVETGETAQAGAVIGLLGKTGMATGPNLSFAMYQDGEAVNPVKE